MSQTINQVKVLTALNNLMGRRVLPGGVQEDLKRYCQQAFDYAWRYYRWSWSLKTATLADDGNGNTYMPADFDLDGYRRFTGATEVLPGEITTSSTSFVLEYDMTANRYKTVPASPGVAVVYQIAPPTLTENTEVPFPSAMTIAIGASVYAKQAENPTRADITQEFDEFHQELDRHVARAGNNQQRRRPVTFHDINGTYTGYTGA